MMVCVIADDITGAAEMAGIAHRLGLSVCLSLDGRLGADCDVAVIATDTRSMTRDEAAREMRRVLDLAKADSRASMWFKKTDSALRGHVVAELSEMMAELGFGSALYLPANPSKGRTISAGKYLIDGVPIDRTAFSYDPEFPAFSSLLSERMPDAAAHGIMWHDIRSMADIEAAVERASAENILLAGAADLFAAFLKRIFPHAAEKSRSWAPPSQGSCIIVCGSTQSDPGQCGVPPVYMPADLYDGLATAGAWVDALAERYAASPHRVLLAVAHRHRTGREAAVHIRRTMADAVRALVNIRVPRDLIIEGGATAYSILRALGWNRFRIQEEIAPGVISMRVESAGCTVTMKPGSYPWGGLFTG